MNRIVRSPYFPSALSNPGTERDRSTRPDVWRDVPRGENLRATGVTGLHVVRPPHDRGLRAGSETFRRRSFCGKTESRYDEAHGIGVARGAVYLLLLRQGNSESLVAALRPAHSILSIYPMRHKRIRAESVCQ